MNGIKGFNLKRILLLIKNDLFLHRSFFQISAAAVGGMLLILSSLDIILHASPAPNTSFYMKYYALVLTVGGIIVTLKLFHDVKDEAKGAAWLTLPASLPEKFTSRLVLSTILFTVGVMILFFLTSLISEGLNRLITGSNHLLFNPLGKKVFLKSINYYIVQSPFILGMVHFKKNPFIKTILSLVIYDFVFIISVVIALRIFFGGYFQELLSGSLDALIVMLSDESVALTKIWSIITGTVHVAYLYVLAPLCWITGYIRLKEKEL